MSIHRFIEYIEKEKKFSNHTVKAYTTDLNEFSSFCKNIGENTPVDQIDYSSIRLWIVTMVNDGKSNRTINRKISVLRSFYSYLMRIGDRTSHPLRQHKPLKEEKTIQLPFSENEINTLLDGKFFSDDYKGILSKTIIETFYGTGIRRSELIQLQTLNIDFKEGLMKVMGKRNKERIIPIIPSLLEQLKRYQAVKLDQFKTDSDLFFRNIKGEKLPDNFVYSVVNDYFKNVSTKDKKSQHMLRHSFATHLLNQGADLNTVKDLLGHVSLAATQIYTHTNMQQIKAIYKDAHPRGDKK